MGDRYEWEDVAWRRATRCNKLKKDRQNMLMNGGLADISVGTCRPKFSKSALEQMEEFELSQAKVWDYIDSRKPWQLITNQGLRIFIVDGIEIRLELSTHTVCCVKKNQVRLHNDEEKEFKDFKEDIDINEGELEFCLQCVEDLSLEKRESRSRRRKPKVKKILYTELLEEHVGHFIGSQGRHIKSIYNRVGIDNGVRIDVLDDYGPVKIKISANNSDSLELACELVHRHLEAIMTKHVLGKVMLQRMRSRICSRDGFS